MRKDNPHRAVSFIVGSILLHALLLHLMSKKHDFSQLDLHPEDNSVTFLDIQNVQDQIRREIVEQDEKRSKEADPNAQFLGKHNKQVKKETRAAQRGDFKNATKSQSAPQPQPPSQASAAYQPATDSIETPEFKTFSHGDVFAGSQKKKAKPSPLGAFRPNNVANLANKGTVSRPSQTNDHLKDVEIGAATHLNTREFKYYSYFNRIKKRLRQFWEPKIQEKVERLVRRGRRPASMTSKLTRLVITLNEKGTLTKVQLRTTSGLEDLDDAAIEAFRAAAPFPNPPKDLIKGGLVQIDWSFVLET